MKHSKFDFVFVGLQPWYTTIGSNCKNIALELSKSHRVLYINSPLDRRTLLRKNSDKHIARHAAIAAGKQPALEQVSDSLWVYYPKRVLESLNWIPFTAVFELLNRINSRRYARDIAEATATLGFKEYILFNDNELFRSIHLKQLLKPALYIYYCRDYLRAVPYWKKHGKSTEPKQIRQADLAFANSAYLRDYLKQFNSRSYDIGQGCDTQLFNGKHRYEQPDDIRALSRPRIGYIGALTALRLDIKCIELIALAMPEAKLVLVGPEDDVFRQSRLHQLPNVVFTGKKPLSQLAGYIQAFDVCINPQLLNEMTIGNYPLKVDEYLNMGKPVVATHTKTMEMFEDHVYLADRREGYPELISKALEQDNPVRADERIRFASGHTWPAVISAMLAHITQFLGQGER